MMANSFHAFINLEDYMGWVQLFGLEESEPIFQKRILSIVSGAILPIVALGFIKSLVDYIRPVDEDVILGLTLTDDVGSIEHTDEGPYTFETDKEIIPEEVVTEEVVTEEEIEKEEIITRDVSVTPFGDPITIPTDNEKTVLTNRPFIRSVEYKP